MCGGNQEEPTGKLEATLNIPPARDAEGSAFCDVLWVWVHLHVEQKQLPRTQQTALHSHYQLAERLVEKKKKPPPAPKPPKTHLQGRCL